MEPEALFAEVLAAEQNRLIIPDEDEPETPVVTPTHKATYIQNKPSRFRPHLKNRFRAIQQRQTK